MTAIPGLLLYKLMILNLSFGGSGRVALHASLHFTEIVKKVRDYFLNAVYICRYGAIDAYFCNPNRYPMCYFVKQVKRKMTGCQILYFFTYTSNFSTFVALPSKLFDSFLSVPDILILLWLTPDDFTRQGEKSRTGKG